MCPVPYTSNRSVNDGPDLPIGKILELVACGNSEIVKFVTRFAAKESRSIFEISVDEKFAKRSVGIVGKL